MNKVAIFTLCIMPVVGASELVEMAGDELSDTSAQSGITLDIDISNVGITYNYTNDENPNETYWIAGTGAGTGDSAVGAGIGSGAGLAQVNGITIDVVQLTGVSGNAAIAIGMPSEVRLNRVNTGDYYVAHPGANAQSAPIVNDTIDRKLFGLKWNTPPSLNFAAAGQGAAAASVVNRDFSSDVIRMSGRALIFAD